MRISVPRLMFVSGFAIFFVLIGYTVYQHCHRGTTTQVTLCGFLWDAKGENPQPIKVTMEPDLVLSQPYGGVVTLRACNADADFGSLNAKDFEPVLAMKERM